MISKGNNNNGNNSPGILDGLTKLLETVADLAEKGQEMKESGLFETESGKQGRVNFGFSIRNAGEGNGSGGASDFKVEPFGNIRKNPVTGSAELDETREPIVDVFDEDDSIQVIAEMPGIEADSIKVSPTEDAQGDSDIFILEGASDSKKYYAEVELPQEVDLGAAKINCNNGIAEIVFNKKAL